MPESRPHAQSINQPPPACGPERLESGRDETRRGFIRGSSLLLAGALPAAVVAADSPAGKEKQSSRTLKIGLVGCGYRGIAATSELLSAATLSVPVQLTALADVFPDRLQQAFRTLRGRFGDLVSPAGTSRYVGLQAFEQLLATDVDVVLLATPPVFRPQHFEAAVAAGKHVYAETPIATDIPGIDRFQAALVDSRSRGLAVAVGLSRYQPILQQTMEQLRQGAIGQILHIQALHPKVARKTPAGPGASTDFQSQLRHWSSYAWASGGSLLEQRVRGLDMVNWLTNSHPVEARRLQYGSPPAQAGSEGMTVGGIETGEEDVLEFSYPGGAKLISAAVSANRVSGKIALIAVHGSAGWCDLAAGKIFDVRNELSWQADEAFCETRGGRFAAAAGNVDLGRSPGTPRPTGGGDSGGLWHQFLMEIRAGQAGTGVGAVGQAAVDSTRTAILGRMAAGAPGPVSWDECLRSQEVFASIALSRATLALTAIG